MSTNPSGWFFQSGNISWSRHRFSYCCRVFAYAYGSHEWTRYSTRMTPERGTYCIGCGRNALREKTTDSEWSNMKPCFFPISCSDSRFSLFGNGSLELWFWVFTYHLVEAQCPPPPRVLTAEIWCAYVLPAVCCARWIPEVSALRNANVVSQWN